MKAPISAARSAVQAASARAWNSRSTISALIPRIAAAARAAAVHQISASNPISEPAGEAQRDLVAVIGVAILAHPIDAQRGALVDAPLGAQVRGLHLHRAAFGRLRRIRPAG